MEGGTVSLNLCQKKDIRAEHGVRLETRMTAGMLAH